jgi:hypothetical protein
LLKRKRSIGRAIAVLGAAVAMVSGSSAVASAAPAVFSTPSSGTIQWILKTPLNIRVGSGGTNCNAGTNQLDASTFSNVGSPLQGTVAGWQSSLMACGTLVTILQSAPMTAENNGGSLSLNSASSLRFYATGWNATGTNVAWSVPWTNGTGVPGALGAPTITFNNTLVANSNTGLPIRLTGTVIALNAGQLS